MAGARIIRTFVTDKKLGHASSLARLVRRVEKKSAAILLHSRLFRARRHPSQLNHAERARWSIIEGNLILLGEIVEMNCFTSASTIFFVLLLLHTLFYLFSFFFPMLFTLQDVSPGIVIKDIPPYSLSELRSKL